MFGLCSRKALVLILALLLMGCMTIVKALNPSERLSFPVCNMRWYIFPPRAVESNKLNFTYKPLNSRPRLISKRLVNGTIVNTGGPGQFDVALWVCNRQISTLSLWVTTQCSPNWQFLSHPISGPFFPEPNPCFQMVGVSLQPPHSIYASSCFNLWESFSFLNVKMHSTRPFYSPPVALEKLDGKKREGSMVREEKEKGENMNIWWACRGRESRPSHPTCQLPVLAYW